jgi:hypothetical protein
VRVAEDAGHDARGDEGRSLIRQRRQQARQQRDVDALSLSGAVAVAQRGRMPMLAWSPAMTSTTATPTFVGAPGAGPVMLIRPPTACGTRS